MGEDSPVVVLCGPTHLPGMTGTKVYQLTIDGQPHLVLYRFPERDRSADLSITNLYISDHSNELLRVVPRDPTTEQLFQQITVALLKEVKRR